MGCIVAPILTSWPGEGLAWAQQVTQREKVFVGGLRDSLLLWQLTIRPQPWETCFPCVCEEAE